MITALLVAILFVLICAFAKQVGKGLVIVAGIIALLYIIGTLSGGSKTTRASSKVTCADATHAHEVMRERYLNATDEEADKLVPLMKERALLRNRICGSETFEGSK